MKRVTAVTLAVVALALGGCGGGESSNGPGIDVEPSGREPVQQADVIVVNARTEPPNTNDSNYEQLGDRCFAGSMSACDELYGVTPGGSIEEAYGWGCGGRVDTDRIEPGRCSQAIISPLRVPDAIVDPTFRTLATTCFGGGMAACDDLFRSGPDDTVDELYGATCGGRVIGARALCIDIFGDQAPG